MICAEELGDLMGWAAVAELVRAIGGRDYLVPERIDSDRGEELSVIVGRGPANALIGYAAGSHIYIPRACSARAASRHRVVKELHRSGWSVEQIQNKVRWEECYTTRQIYAIIAETETVQPAPLEAFGLGCPVEVKR